MDDSGSINRRTHVKTHLFHQIRAERGWSRFPECLPRVLQREKGGGITIESEQLLRRFLMLSGIVEFDVVILALLRHSKPNEPNPSSLDACIEMYWPTNVYVPNDHERSLSRLDLSPDSMRVARTSGNATSTLDPSVPSANPDQQGTHFMFAASVGTDTAIGENDFMALPVEQTISESLGSYKAATGHDLTAELDEQSISFTNRGKLVLHQSIALSLMLRKDWGRDLSIIPWNNVLSLLGIISGSSTAESVARARMVDHKLFTSYLRQGSQLVVCNNWDENGPYHEMAVEKMQEQARSSGYDMRFYPNHDEVRVALYKIGDIQALDEIAKQGGDDMGFRPVTCLHHGKHVQSHEACALSSQLGPYGIKVIWKRSESWAGGHIVVARSSTSIPEMVQVKRRSKPSSIWFAQRFLSCFDEFGEFRIFIATQPDPAGLRGVGGKIISRIVTTVSPRGMTARVLGEDYLRSALSGKIGLQQLDAFALTVFERIRARSDALSRFESFEVGVRMDIAMDMSTGTPRLFVNELTRHWFAIYFSQQTLPAPHLNVCKAYAESMSRYFSSS